MADTDAGAGMIELPLAEFEQFAAELNRPADLVPELVELFQRTSKIPDA